MGESKMTKAEQDKAIIEKLPPFTTTELKLVREDLIRYFEEQAEVEHFMLLSNDINYYTIFKKENILLKTDKARAMNFFDFIFEDSFLKTLGKPKVVKRSGEDQVEIWIGTTPFVLFNADSFFVEI